MAEFAGVYAAAVTPRDDDGSIDFGRAFEMIDYLCAGGVRGVVLFDAAGEYPAFSPADRARLVYLAVKRSRVPVLAGVGSTTLADSVFLARQACDDGAAGLLLPPAFFFRYDQQDIREFYLQFAAESDAAEVTVIGNAGGEIERETARELLAAGFAAMACGSADWRSNRLLIANDAQLPCALGSGFCGAISETAGALPELAAGLERTAAAGNRAEGERLAALWSEFVAWAERFPRPVAVKVAAGLRGPDTGPLPVPLAPARQALLDEFRDWFRGWSPRVLRLAAHA